MGRLLEKKHVAMVLPPAANVFSGTVTTAPVRLSDYEQVEFLVECGAGATGTTLITAEACDDTSGTNPVAIPFEMASQAAGANADDTWSAYADQTASGFTTAAGSYRSFAIRVRARQLPSPKQFIRLKCVEQVASAVAGAIVAVLSGPRYSQVPNRKVLS